MNTLIYFAPCSMLFIADASLAFYTANRKNGKMEKDHAPWKPNMGKMRGLKKAGEKRSDASGYLNRLSVCIQEF